jgi:hypothetical protein
MIGHRRKVTLVVKTGTGTLNGCVEVNPMNRTLDPDPAMTSPRLNRPLLGMLVGAALGVLDGLSALLSAPEVREQIAGIVIGSSVKGLVAGLITGFIARKLASSRAAVLVGTGVAFVLTAPIAYLNAKASGDASYYYKIMLPGALVGALVGYMTMRYGRAPTQ